MKKGILLISCILLMAVLILPTCALTDGQRVFDGGELLSAAEEQRIANAIANTKTPSECDFYFVTFKGTEVRRAGGREFLGDRFLRENGLSDDDTIIVLTVYRENNTYYYDVFTYGNAYSNISDKEIDYILDHPTVYDNIKGGNLAGGAESFFALSAKAYRGRVGVSYVIIGSVSLVIGALIGSVACFGVWKSYKRKKRPVEYPLDRYAKMELREQEDVFTGSFVTSRVIQSNSGGRSGGGGGGGGHRGGR